MISLLMLSGGIDSAYTLAKLLKDTDDEVLVHHIHLVTNSGRHEPEAEACKEIVEFCQAQYRPFSYTQSAIDRRRFVAHGYDLMSAGTEAGIVSASYFITTGNIIDRWFVGLADDDLVPRTRVKRAQDCCEYNCQEGNAPGLFLYEQISLQAQIDYMPVKLLNATWSCRSPGKEPGKDGDEYKPCGECAACKRRNSVERSKKPRLSKAEQNVKALPWTRLVHKGGPHRKLYKER
jgi:7-cyano-7-deazaguanine synthase in queuosine biosynthesis